MKTVVLVGGGVESMHGIDVAHRLGYQACVVDGNATAPGLLAADERVVASTYDTEAVYEAVSSIAKKSQVVGVMSVGTDVPVTVAVVAARLGLPGIPVFSAKLSANKLLMKQRFLDSGIPTPSFWPVDNESDIKKAMRDSENDLFVLKPVDSRGARGVRMIRRTDDLTQALAESRSYSTSKLCILEEFESGPQISSESYFTPQWHETPGFSDRNYARMNATYPYIIEDGGEAPSRASEREVQEASAVAVEAAKVLGVESGTVKGDLVLTNDGPKVIEIALRLSGGWFCTHQIPTLTGVDLVEAAMRQAVGNEVTRDSVTPNRVGGVAIRYFFPPPGLVLGVPSAVEIEAMPGVVHHHINVRVGDRVQAITDHTGRAGHVIAVGASRDEAVARASSVIRELPILVDSE